MGDSSPDLERVKRRLLERRDALLEVAESGEEAEGTVTLDQSRVGRLSRMDALQAQAMAKESGRRRRLELQRIGAALKRIEDGEYGYCLTCGEEIAEDRLTVDPSASQCIDCADKSERGAS